MLKCNTSAQSRGTQKSKLCLIQMRERVINRAFIMAKSDDYDYSWIRLQLAALDVYDKPELCSLYQLTSDRGTF